MSTPESKGDVSNKGGNKGGNKVGNKVGNSKVYVVSKISSNMNRYTLSVHKTEEGAARAILKDYSQGDWYCLQELLGLLDDDEEVLTTAQMTEAVCRMIQEYHTEYHTKIQEGLFKELWADEQDRGYEMDCFVVEE